MCMEVLSRLLDKAARDGAFGYHPKCRALRLTHLVFADDLVIISAANQQSLQDIKSVLDTFYFWCGLKVSFNKSEIFLSSLYDEIIPSLIEPLGIKKGSMPVKYLGVPLISGKLSFNDCMPLIDKVTKRINSWGVKCLSYAG